MNPTNNKRPQKQTYTKTNNQIFKPTLLLHDFYSIIIFYLAAGFQYLF